MSHIYKIYTTTVSPCITVECSVPLYGLLDKHISRLQCFPQTCILSRSVCGDDCSVAPFLSLLRSVVFSCVFDAVSFTPPPGDTCDVSAGPVISCRNTAFSLATLKGLCLMLALTALTAETGVTVFFPAGDMLALEESTVRVVLVDVVTFFEFFPSPVLHSCLWFFLIPVDVTGAVVTDSVSASLATSAAICFLCTEDVLSIAASRTPSVVVSDAPFFTFLFFLFFFIGGSEVGVASVCCVLVATSCTNPSPVLGCVLFRFVCCLLFFLLSLCTSSEFTSLLMLCLLLLWIKCLYLFLLFGFLFGSHFLVRSTCSWLRSVVICFVSIVLSDWLCELSHVNTLLGSDESCDLDFLEITVCFSSLVSHLGRFCPDCLTLFFSCCCEPEDASPPDLPCFVYNTHYIYWNTSCV